MVNKITNTPIRVDHYGSLALRQMRHQSHGNCVVQPDGTLWAALPDPADNLGVFRSTDGGFSWSRPIYATGISQRWATPGSAKGPINFIMIDEQYRNFDLVGVEWENLGSTFDINRSRYDLDDLAEAPSNTLITSNVQGSAGVFDLSYSHRNAILVFHDGTNIGAMLLSPRTTSTSNEVDDSDTQGAGGMCSIIDENSIAYVAYTQTGANNLRFNKFTSSASGGTWGTPATVSALGDTDRWVDDPVISLDGYGTLMIAYGLRDISANTCDLKYVLSTDTGTTWDTVSGIDRESGYEVYIEPVNSLATSYVDGIGGRDGGFIITYCDKQTADGLGHTFVRHLATSDGVTYTLSDQKEIGTRYSGKDVVGGHFFRPTTIKLLDLSDPGFARIAYTVGEGDDAEGDDDMVPVTIAQELLSEVAFPSTLTTDTGSYTDSTAASNELKVQFNTVGSPQDNVDFSALGMTGNETTKYANAFNKVGTNIRFLRYEPTQANLMNDQSAYSAPTESIANVIFDPISYSQPAGQAVVAGSVDALMERDVRKIFMPASKHLARTFVVNDGGYLKRTVWLVEYDGNQYEVSQVVPRWISNQICYYEANAYVVGPSRDPFSRTILPSET